MAHRGILCKDLEVLCHLQQSVFPRFCHILSLRPLEVFRCSGVLFRTTLLNSLKWLISRETAGALSLGLLHLLPSAIPSLFIPLKYELKSVFIILMLVVTGRTNWKRPRILSIATMSMCPVSGSCFFRRGFCQRGFENFLGYGLLVFSSQDLGFSCVYVLLRNSLNIPAFLSLKNSTQHLCTVLANFKKGKDKNLLVQLRMSLGSSRSF